jgi:hypothetical protein
MVVKRTANEVGGLRHWTSNRGRRKSVLQFDISVSSGGKMHMTRVPGLIYRERLQYLVFAALSVGAVVLVGLIYNSSDRGFQRFIGNINPIVASLTVVGLGFIFLTFLLNRAGLVLYKKANRQGRIRASALAAVFGLLIILMDLKIVFRADINIPFPESLWFYPAIGFFAEIIFHLAPLSLLLIALTAIFRNTGREKIVLFRIPVVALLEPAYQVIWMRSANQYSLWAGMFVGLLVYLINLFQLLIFRCYDFVSMYVFRLVYYLFWHIGWGLDILF